MGTETEGRTQREASNSNGAIWRKQKNETNFELGIAEGAAKLKKISQKQLGVTVCALK